MTSSLSLARRRGESTLYLGIPGADTTVPRFHPAPARNEVPFLQPVLVRIRLLNFRNELISNVFQVKALDGELTTDIEFFSRGIFTANRAGLVRLWIRPLSAHPRHMKGRSHHVGRVFVDTDLIS